MLMKKMLVMAVMLGLLITNLSAQMNKNDLILVPMMNEQFSSTELEQYRQNDFAKLFELNYRMINYATVCTKLPTDNYQIVGNLEKYALAGVTVNEEDILQNGINPFLFNLPQDNVRYNVFPMRKNGYYVLVLPKRLYDERMNANLQNYIY